MYDCTWWCANEFKLFTVYKMNYIAMFKLLFVILILQYRKRLRNCLLSLLKLCIPLLKPLRGRVIIQAGNSFMASLKVCCVLLTWCKNCALVKWEPMASVSGCVGSRWHRYGNVKDSSLCKQHFQHVGTASIATSYIIYIFILIVWSSKRKLKAGSDII